MTRRDPDDPWGNPWQEDLDALDAALSAEAADQRGCEATRAAQVVGERSRERPPITRQRREG